jgi:hypothetical protein
VGWLQLQCEGRESSLKETRDEFSESIHIEYHLNGRLRHFFPQKRSNGHHPRQAPLPILVLPAPGTVASEKRRLGRALQDTSIGFFKYLHILPDVCLFSLYYNNTLHFNNCMDSPDTILAPSDSKITLLFFDSIIFLTLLYTVFITKRL